MGDRHFLLQNTLTGLVCVAFFLLGTWIVDNQLTKAILNFILSQWKVLALLLYSPILGVFIQGFWMFFQYLKKHPYSDRSRELLASQIRDSISSTENIPKDIISKLVKLPDDSLFVWLYYSEAKDILIEWARRRRDFQHIGENWTAGAVFGFLFGIFYSIFIVLGFHRSSLIISMLILILLAIWVIGLLFLRNKMKQDADALELTWAVSILFPEIRKRVEYNK